MITQAAPVPLTPTDPPAEVHFPDGLVGCEQWRHFVMEPPTEGGAPVWLMRSQDDPTCNFLLADPFRVSQGYAYDPSPEDLAALGAIEDEPVQFCTLSIGDDGWITANLLGPLLVHPRTGLGRQVVLSDTRYPLRFRVAPLNQPA